MKRFGNATITFALFAIAAVLYAAGAKPGPIMFMVAGALFELVGWRRVLRARQLKKIERDIARRDAGKRF